MPANPWPSWALWNQAAAEAADEANYRGFLAYRVALAIAAGLFGWLL